MTLLYAIGWDLCTTFSDSQLEGWAVSAAIGGGDVLDIQTSNGRSGGACLRMNRGGAGGNTAINVIKPIGTVTTQSFVGVAMNAVTIGLNSFIQNIIAFVDGATTQIDLRLNAQDGSLILTRNGTTLATSAAGTVTYGAYHYYELGFVIASGTGGSVTVRRDLTTVLSVSGVNTQATANPRWTQVSLGGGTQQPNIDYRYDDLYICDNQGAVNNTYLGDVGIRAELPSAAGSNSGFTRTGGSAGGNYTAVNEKPNDGDTSYVSDGTIGTIDTYLYPALSTRTSTVFGVIAKPVARKDDAGNRHITARYRAAGGSEADFTATDITLSSSYAQSAQVQELNPVTSSAWLPSEISSGEFGPRISS